ncbi:MAG: glycosyltransferase [Pleomorphochaeta sp.]
MLQKYSVLMSVYEKEKPNNLKISIDSMLEQTHFPDEIVLVEDGPLPDSLNCIIENFAKNYKNLFKIIKLNKNMGLGTALNVGLLNCKNELVARMDTDDISISSRCEKQVRRFMLNSNLNILGTQIYEFVDDPLNVISQRYVPCSFNEIKKFARRRSPFNHPSVMYKKSIILKYGGYKGFGRKEDLELFLKLVFENCYSENLEEPLLYYRTNNSNMRRRKTWINCSEYIHIMHNFYNTDKISLVDFVYVVFGQLIIYILPFVLFKKINFILLRKRKKIKNE